jgi:FkbM family methyltransferase
MSLATIVEIETPYGPLALDKSSDKKMWMAFEKGVYPNEELIQLAQRFLTLESIVVDIGAHIGTYSVPLRCAQVIAFEPAPDTFSILERNTSNSLGKFDLRKKGLAERPGSASVIQRNYHNAGAQTLVPGGDIVVTTLDSEVQQADFIKIDVEGMEEGVLLGGVELIKRCKPTVQFEVNLSQLRAHDSSPKVLEKFFRQHGYKLFFPLIQNGEVVSLSEISSLTLLSALIAPRAWLLHGDSAPFDVLAVAEGKKLPVARSHFSSAIVWALKNNVTLKMRRLLKSPTIIRPM